MNTLLLAEIEFPSKQECNQQVSSAHNAD